MGMLNAFRREIVVSSFVNQCQSGCEEHHGDKMWPVLVQVEDGIEVDTALNFAGVMF